MSVFLEVQDILSNPSYCPCLLLGGYTIAFKKTYAGRIFKAYTLEDVRNLVEDFSGISDMDGMYLVIDGIGYLNDIGQNSLLKFIEESKLPIVLLSYYDKVSPIIQSRMKFTFKESIIKVKSLKFMSISSAVRVLEEKKQEDKEMSDIDEAKFLAESCPKAFGLLNMAGSRDYASRRVLKLLSKFL
jgi:hypothetical protein